jgi:hypothetical protein
MIVNKHKIIQDWVQTFLEDEHLYFESADAYPGIRTITPQYGEYVTRTDICGFKYKSYSFIFIGYEQIDTGTSDVNTTNMYIMDKFTEWLETQKETENFPDFGQNCSEYDIIPIQDIANLATIQDDGLAKYMLGVRIDYKEEP